MCFGRVFGWAGHNARFAQAVLDIAPSRFALAGLSMGGLVAMEIVRQAPERVTRLALLDTTPLADAPEKGPVRERQVRDAQTGRLSDVMREELKPAYVTDGPRRQAILDQCMSMALDLGQDVFANQSHAVQHRDDQRETLKSVRVPTLALCGEDDELCPRDRHELIHSLVPNSKLSIIRGAGHMPTLEQPDLTNEALNTWLTM